MDKDLLVRGSILLAKIAQEMAIPILVTVSKQPAPQGLLVPELEFLASKFPVVERTIINAWEDPNVRSFLEQSGRTQMIFTGVALDVGVALPALGAIRSGFSAIIPVDAVGTTDSRIESAALLNLAMAGVSLTSVQAIGMELLGDVASASSARILKMLGSAHSAAENPFQSG